MPSPIAAIPPIALPEPRVSGPEGGAAGSGGFPALLAGAIGGVERLRGDAHRTAQQFLAGEGQEVHSVALAAQRAELAFETFVQVRNKVVSAYQAVMQMQM